MRTLIVDDEPLARRELRRLLRATPWVEVVGEAANVDDAAGKVAELQPGLVLLDVQMPGGTGFDLLVRLDPLPQVIFTTAYDRHAVRAFDVNAVDYLLKPVDPERLAVALARVERPLPGSAATLDPLSAPKAFLDRLLLRDRDEGWIVRVDEISLFASEGNYVVVHWNGRTPLLTRSLLSLESQLDPRRFFRANRQQIVQLDFVEAIEMGKGGTLHAQLRGGPEVALSRRQARLLRERLTR